MAKLEPYIVRQGDYLTKLASIHGFDAQTVWNDPANAELKNKRPDPELLCPGDVLMIPNEPPTGIALVVGAANRIVGTVPTTHVHMCFETAEGDPYKTLDYIVEGAGYEIKGTTDANGAVEFDVPVGAREVCVVFPDILKRFPLCIGDLDPIEEQSGIIQRLEQLGYRGWALAGLSEAPIDQRPECDEAAIRSFQHDQQLAETGIMDAATRAALLKAHGV
jgi:Putative peptidoglycan binding domain